MNINTPNHIIGTAVAVFCLVLLAATGGCVSNRAQDSGGATALQDARHGETGGGAVGDTDADLADAEGSQSAEPEPLPDPRLLTAIDGRTGMTVTWPAVLARLSLADVVLIGEQHGHRVGLHTAAELWSDLLKRSPYAALSMEFFERDEQVAIDDYFAGITDEEGFRTASGRTPGNYPDGHRRMVERAKEVGRPVMAANAPRRYVRLARIEGYEFLEGLTPEQQRFFVIPEFLPDSPYRERFFDVMGQMMTSHGTAKQAAVEEETGTDPAEHADSGTGLPPEVEAQIESFYRSQVMWEATMADSIITLLESGSSPVVHVVGQFHTDFEGGQIEQLDIMSPGLDIVTVSMVDAWSDELREEDQGRADFVFYVGPRQATGDMVSMSAEPIWTD